MLFLFVCESIYSQSANYQSYLNEMLQKAQSFGTSMRKEYQQKSQLAKRSSNKDIYTLYLNGNELVCFSDELSCQTEISKIKSGIGNLMESFISGLPRSVPRSELRNSMKDYLNSLNFTYRKEANPNYIKSDLGSNNMGISSGTPSQITTTPATTSIFSTPSTSTDTNTSKKNALGSLQIGTQESGNTPKTLYALTGVTTQGDNNGIREYIEKPTLNPFSKDALELKKKELQAEWNEIFYNCSKFDEFACRNQLKRIEDELDVIKKREEGREEWLGKIRNISPEALKAQERNYEKLAEMAGLAEYSYKEKQGKPDGWEPVNNGDLSTIIDRANDNKSGFHCELLEDGNGKYVLSFRGTELSLKDIRADLIEALCPRGQTNEAISVVEKLKNAGIDLDNITVTGHSLGGRLAAEVAIAKGLTAYTFNAADISVTTKAAITTTGFINPNTNIINTVSANDPLTRTVGLGSYFGGNISNNQLIKEAYGNGLGEGHSITFLQQAIKQRHQDIKDMLK